MEILITSKEIQDRIAQLANDIVVEHKDSKNSLPPVMICILNGGFMFFNDLIRKMSIDVEIDFIRLKSYNGRDNSAGVSIIKDLEVDCKGKRVYIIDDMCDTGSTLLEAVNMVNSRMPNDIKLVTLIQRKEGIQLADHCGFEVGPNWLVGMGLDSNNLLRTLEDIYTIN